MIKVGIGGIGIVTAGIESWPSALPVLRGNIAHTLKTELPVIAPSLLPANEQRRATPLIKLALCSAQQAMDQFTQATGSHEDVASVFASGYGDLTIDDRILQTLQMQERPVSPTDFHNSVHNAAAGYWSIATGSHAASSSLSAFDASFSAGLLEAATQVVVEKKNVLLVAYDMPPPAILSDFCPLQSTFSCALLLTAENTEGSYAQVEIALTTTASYDKMNDPNLEALRAHNPAARSLPLLQRLANNTQATAVIPYLNDQCLKITVLPC